MFMFKSVFLIITFLGFYGNRCLATGALFVRPFGTAQTYSLMSIKTYDAVVTIQDQVATTHVDQKFFNSSNQRVEATFIFPLPESAIITELIYWFNGKQYVASLRERKDAQKAYDEKIRKLMDPALLQYLGDNMFKLNIAPIDPQSEVRFAITYAELLPYDFGMVDYRFLLKTTGLSPQPLDRISVSIDATTARSFTSFDSPSHGNTAASKITQINPSHYTVTFGDEKFLPDRDLVIRFGTRRQSMEMNVLTYVPTVQDSFGLDSFYALWITPPDTVLSEPVARNIVFAADVSSSMEGRRIDELKQALTSFLDGLTTGDRFNIVVFSTNVMSFRPDLVQATSSEVAAARAFVSGLGAAGLTNIDEALRSSLAMSYDTSASDILVFMTDGYPTWGEQNLQAIIDSTTAGNRLGVRIFPFGIGDSVSRTLLNGLAERNRGYATYIPSDDSIAAAVSNYFRRVSQPVLSDLSIDYAGLQAYDRYPTTFPELFSGTQLLQFGRYTNSGTFPIGLRGRLGQKTFLLVDTVFFGTTSGGNRAIARLWAKRKIDYLTDQIGLYGERKELVDAIIDLSIRFGILSQYTAFYSDPIGTSDAPEEQDLLLPTRPVLQQNLPNPFSGATRIDYYIPAGVPHHASIMIHDLSGRLVRVLVDGEVEPGHHQMMWDGKDGEGNDLPAGTYLCTLKSGDVVETRMMFLVR
jgi:Ca-activated chloride channel family protein